MNGTYRSLPKYIPMKHVVQWFSKVVASGFQGCSVSEDVTAHLYLYMSAYLNLPSRRWRQQDNSSLSFIEEEKGNSGGLLQAWEVGNPQGWLVGKQTKKAEQFPRQTGGGGVQETNSHQFAACSSHLPCLISRLIPTLFSLPPSL